MNHRLFRRGLAGAALFLLIPLFVVGQSVDISILATSDVHTHYLPYDYFTDTPVETDGLVMVATAIRQEREKNPNVLLFDDGDNIQGTPLGDYLAKNPPQGDEISPIMRLLNAMDYDAMALGNHEFNFGLEYLNTIIRGSQFPTLCANVVNPITKTPYFTPYTILLRPFVDDQGNSQMLRIGVLGLTPPQILAWDGAHVRGKVEALDGPETARRYVPEMKAKGADLVVILAHSGIDDSFRRGREENFAWYLTEIPDVDVVISGHVHMKFPGPAYAEVRGVDLDAGTINGVSTLMPNCFGDTLGVVNLRLTYEDGKWRRAAAASTLIPIYDTAAKKSIFPVDENLSALLAEEHEATVAYIRSPVGGEGEDGAVLTAPLNSFFALVKDDYSVQIINEAQAWYAEEIMKSTPYADLPILSAAAPFKAGGRQGPGYYTNVAAGPLAIKNIADLYVYSNTIVIVKASGADLREWLEMSAGQFNRIDPAVQDEQFLINETFPTYNYDVIDGLTYTIDLGQPPRYGTNGALQNPEARRITDLRYRGNALQDTDEFAVVTNNYRAYGGGNFPGVGPSQIIFAAPDENRQVILKYLEYAKRIEPRADGNWKLNIPGGAGPAVFYSSPLGENAGEPGIRFLRTDGSAGYGVYQLLPEEPAEN
jgi:2',3'-cyclic-nucleotide 2'-phosphodiesterase/3'-nucleotidase